VTKPISHAGFTENFLPRVEAMLAKSGEIRLLVYYADFHGWEEQATRDDSLAYVRFGDKVRKIALVAPPEKEMFKSKIKKPIIGGEMRYFNETELQDALTWIRA
ncbi:MAG: STAS/SEC14 domain-containing protein, partial [Micavibrio aeruginosavorus]|nr:STAS/SEC14 domain-containing protein [Micavibrio aeruginosavorus]